MRGKRGSSSNSPAWEQTVHEALPRRAGGAGKTLRSEAESRHESNSHSPHVTLAWAAGALHHGRADVAIGWLTHLLLVLPAKPCVSGRWPCPIRSNRRARA